MQAAPTQEEQIHYLFYLRNLKSGWTLDQRRQYFSWWNKDRKGLEHPTELVQWFKDVDRDYQDGASFLKFLANFKKEAIASLSDSDRTALRDILEGQLAAVPAAARVRSFVKEWKMADLLPELDKVSNGRSFARGRQAFLDAQCLACHRFGNEGGAVGPELTAASSKYSRRDILEAIIEPSKVVSEQYQNALLTLKDGDRVIGRVLDDKADRLVLETEPLGQTRKEVLKNDIQKREPSTISPMPEGLVNVLTKEEILDLLAYIESGGKKKHPVFSRN
jgi:putative heme-binding domain-containing protein